MLLYKIKYFILRTVCFFIGHDWSEWLEMVGGEGFEGFVTISDKCSRECERCYKKEYRDWNAEEKKILDFNLSNPKFSLGNGEFGVLTGTTFFSTKKTRPVRVK